MDMAGVCRTLKRQRLLRQLFPFVLSQHRQQGYHKANHSRKLFSESKSRATSVIYDLMKSQIDQASLGLSREYLIAKFEEPFVVAYHNYQIDLAVLFGASRDNAETAMRDVLDFETELAEVEI